MRPTLQGDAARQAIESLGGYAYQIYAAATAWATLAPGETLHLEVAEDFAVATDDAVSAVQVKRTSGTITSNSPAVPRMFDTLFDLREANPGRRVQVRLLTTSEPGREAKKADRVEGLSFIEAWDSRRGSGEIAAIRSRLATMGLAEPTLGWLKSLDDRGFRREVMQAVWFDCGQRPLSALVSGLDDILVDLGTRRGFYAQDSQTTRAAIVERILAVSIEPGGRQLSSADFARTFEGANTRTVPNSWPMGAQGEISFDTRVKVARRSPDVLPLPDEAEREPLMIDLRRQLSRGLLWLHAGTGHGKTRLASKLAQEGDLQAQLIRLRGFDRFRTAQTLARARSELAFEEAGTVIVDDVDHWQDREVAEALRSLLEAARRRGQAVAITSYSAPSQACLTLMEVIPICLREVPYLTEADMLQMVARAPFANDVWARYVRLGSRGGHPQLAHAMVQGLRARGWPKEELTDLAAVLGRDETLNETKDDIRRRLMLELGEDARRLTYRISLVASSFDRGLVDAVSEVPDPVRTPGETLDGLTGPWIDRLGPDEFRLSPLVGDVGSHQLGNAERKLTHAAIAKHLTRGGKIDASRIDQILLSGIAGQAATPLVLLALATFSSPSEELARLAREVPTMAAMRTDRPLYPAEPRVSVQLRMMQVMLTLARETDATQFADALAAFDRELGTLDDRAGRDLLAMTLGAKLLQIPHLGRIHPGFPTLAARTARLARAAGIDMDRPDMEDIDDPEGEEPGSDLPMGKALFAGQMSNIADLDQLEAVLRDLAGLAPGDRALVEPEHDGILYNPEQIVKAVWIKEKGREGFDAAAYAERCEALSLRLDALGERAFAIAATSCTAVNLSEDLAQHEAALALLDEAEKRFGPDYLLTRGRAGIHFTIGDHRRQLEEVARLPYLARENGAIEAAYLMREIAIAHGSLEEWDRSAHFFSDAAHQARASGVEAMKLMAIGLVADEAVVLWRAGHGTEALRRLDAALTQLGDVDPTLGFRQRALHRLVRFAGFWMYAEERKLKKSIPGIEADMVIGCCSNPNPHRGLDELPEGPPEAIGYLLAELDLAREGAAGVWERVEAIPPEDCVLPMECTLAVNAFSAAVVRGSVPVAARFAGRAVDAMAAIRSGLLDSESLNDAPRGKLPIPNTDHTPYRHDVLALTQSLLVDCSLAGERDRLAEFVSIDKASGGPLLSDTEAASLEAGSWDARNPACSSLGSIGQLCDSVAGGRRPHLPALFMATLRIVDIGRQLPKAPQWEAGFSVWALECWREALRDERFRLTTPLEAERVLLPVLAEADEDLRSLAKLILLAEPFVGMSLEAGHRSALREAAKRTA